MSAAPAAPLELRRDEMAFRKKYQELLLSRQITTVFRPGNRIYPAWRGYRRGEVVTARVIEQPGCDARGVAPIFNALSAPIQITDITLRPLSALTPRDFAGSSPDVHDRASLEAHLLEIYGPPLQRFEGLVTRIRFRYRLGSGAGLDLRAFLGALARSPSGHKKQSRKETRQTAGSR